MEFSFKLYNFIQQIEANPHYVIMWAAFGVPALMLTLTLPFYIFRKLGLYPYLKPFYSVIYLSLTITWLLGFVTTMLLLMTNVSGIRMLIIWIIMFLTYLIFTIFNRRSLNTWLDHLTAKSKSGK